MDEDALGKVFGWLIIGAAICYGIYLFVVYVLPWIIIVTLGVGLPGYGLTRLLTTQRYQLSAKSAIALFFVVGFIAWLTSMAVVSSSGISPWFSLLIAPSLFYIQGLILLSVWALYRVAKNWKQLHNLQRQLERSEALVTNLQREVEMARLEVERIDRDHGERMQEAARIDEQLDKLCAREPRSRSLLVRKERISVSSMTAAEIENELRKETNDDDNLGFHVRVLILKKELIQYDLDVPVQKMDKAVKSLQSTQLKLEAAQEAADRLREKKEMYSVSRRSGIIL